MRIKEAFAITYRETKHPFSGMWVFLPFLGAAALVSGVFFAYRDFGKINPFISFIAGCITGTLYIVTGYGCWFGGIFLAVVTSRIIRSEPKRPAKLEP